MGSHPQTPFSKFDRALEYPGANSALERARVIERWQTRVILNLSTGVPTNISAANMLYANGVADVVSPSCFGKAASTGTATLAAASSQAHL